MTAIAQELPLFVASAEVVVLERLLLSHPEWLTAAEILERLNLPVTESHKRQVRAWANASDVVLSGQHGYQHLQHARPDDVKHFCNTMASQATAMSERATRVRRSFEELTAAH